MTEVVDKMAALDPAVAQLAPRLRKGAAAMGIDLSEQQQLQLLQYLGLFIKWNRAYNLSAVRDPVEMVSRHLLDSLSVVPHVDAGLAPDARMIDVGSGGGLPGIPLAIMFPQRQFTLLDSNGKKTRFLFQVKTALGLDNLTVEHRRVESFQPPTLFDGVISRAFASLEDMVVGCKHLLSPQAKFWAMKGIYPQDELSALEKHYKVIDSFDLRVPDCDGQRHLLVLTADGA